MSIQRPLSIESIRHRNKSNVIEIMEAIILCPTIDKSRVWVDGVKIRVEGVGFPSSPMMPWWTRSIIRISKQWYPRATPPSFHPRIIIGNKSRLHKCNERYEIVTHTAWGRWALCHRRSNPGIRSLLSSFLSEGIYWINAFSEKRKSKFPFLSSEQKSILNFAQNVPSRIKKKDNSYLL